MNIKKSTTGTAENCNQNNYVNSNTDRISQKLQLNQLNCKDDKRFITYILISEHPQVFEICFFFFITIPKKINSAERKL